jgi:hypothetical protein
VRLIDLAQDPLIVTPRSLGPTLFDETVALCRRCGFEPIMGQSAPQVASVLALVAAEIGFALVPGTMRETALLGVNYYALEETATVTLALAIRSEEHAPAVLAFTAESRFPNRVDASGERRGAMALAHENQGIVINLSCKCGLGARPGRGLSCMGRRGVRTGLSRGQGPLDRLADIAA